MKENLTGPFQAPRSDGIKPGIGIKRKNITIPRYGEGEYLGTVNYILDEDAISVEQIVFVIAGLAVAIAIGWFIYNLVAGKADDASDIASDANSSKSAGSEFSGGAFGN